jgi:hypothetical protein
MKALSMNIRQREHADRRNTPRACLQLNLAVVYRQHEGRPTRPTFHGTTHDIGMSGLSLVVDRNLFDDGVVTVLLALPPEHTGASPKVITALAKMTYAIHSSRLDAFKIGLSFLEFKSDGKELLCAALMQGLEKVRVAEAEDAWSGLEGAASIDIS